MYYMASGHHQQCNPLMERQRKRRCKAQPRSEDETVLGLVYRQSASHIFGSWLPFVIVEPSDASWRVASFAVTLVLIPMHLRAELFLRCIMLTNRVELVHEPLDWSWLLVDMETTPHLTHRSKASFLHVHTDRANLARDAVGISRSGQCGYLSLQRACHDR